MKAVEGGAPQRGADDEDATVGGEHSPELVAPLEGRHDAVHRQGQRAERDVQRAPVLAKADPHEIRATDLGQRRGDERRERASGHAAVVSADASGDVPDRSPTRLSGAAPMSSTARPATHEPRPSGRESPGEGVLSLTPF
jgi:hypothetical protein